VIYATTRVNSFPIFLLSLFYCRQNPYLYWILKLHKTPFKERYIAGSSTCSAKELSIHLTKILSKEVMNDLWLARISSLSNEVGLYVVLLEVLLFMPNSLIRHSK
jgi:hypothetical protein